MQITDENIKWATRKLSRFISWQGFPVEGEEIASRARSFLRLVHNKPAAQIVAEARKADKMPPIDVDWEAKGIAATQNDADWILDVVEETLERFPLPVIMREIYRAHFPPATNSFKLPESMQ